MLSKTLVNIRATMALHEYQCTYLTKVTSCWNIRWKSKNNLVCMGSLSFHTVLLIFLIVSVQIKVFKVKSILHCLYWHLLSKNKIEETCIQSLHENVRLYHKTRNYFWNYRPNIFKKPIQIISLLLWRTDITLAYKNIWNAFLRKCI